MEQDVQKLIDGLNKDLAEEYGAMIRYTYNAAVVSGLYREVLKPFFEAEVQDEAGHALYLSEKIKILGGDPTTSPAEVKRYEDVKPMLEDALAAEKDTIDRYEERKKQADQLGYTELAVKLEDMISDETKHKEDIQRLLDDPSFK
ncbi:ferritin-like domain-containing protein [Alkalibacillus sp. S2W]|uniref:ferritin-like domain-containing protein n=1 Tax=Alkalibacillus TaxID=331654 RepID=UPI0014216591|nr:ferritin-like domain-containing protein [Alkalibacillus almallahensis]NIK12644.1 bacterioferritin [Alkalibacillus almallahensis]